MGGGRSSSPPSHSIDINCVQDFPSLGGGPNGGGAMSLGAMSNSQNAGGGKHPPSKSIAHKVAAQNRLTIRTSSAGGHSRGRNGTDDEEFPSLLGVTVSTAPQNGSNHHQAATTTSVHLKLNKGSMGNASNNGGSGGANVSIKYNHMMPPTTNKGVKTLEDDFPALSMSSRGGSKTPDAGGWVPTTTDFTSSVPMMVYQKPPQNGDSMNGSQSTNGKGKKNDFQSGGDDFPMLIAQQNSQRHMKNYHGRSSVTIPVTNAWTNSVDHVPRPNEPGNISKGKKKKKNNINNNNNTFNNVSNSAKMSNGSKTNPSKKKPIRLGNIFDDSEEEEDGPVLDFTASKAGDYESVAPSRSSNVNMITQDDLNNRKKSQLNIGTLKNHAASMAFDADCDFPSLGNFPAIESSTKNFSSKASTNSNSANSTNNSWRPMNSKKEKSKANQNSRKANENHKNIPPGFQDTDMTFTTSLGEKYAISPTAERISPFDSDRTSSDQSSRHPTVTPTCTFSPPPNFEVRNKNLIQTITNECAGDKNKFELFKQLAQMLRNGELHGRDYYIQCSEVIGRTTFHRILPELLGLLPDIRKQQVCLFQFPLI